MTTSEFLRALENTLELEPESINGTELLSELSWWDSMAVLVFIAVADEKLQISITGQDLSTCKSVPDVLALLGDKIAR
jgi:acyl carrier protein